MSDSKTISDNQTGDSQGSRLGEIRARRETMADGRRYIIYDTFGDEGDDAANREMGVTFEDV